MLLIDWTAVITEYYKDGNSTLTEEDYQFLMKTAKMANSFGLAIIRKRTFELEQECFKNEDLLDDNGKLLPEYTELAWTNFLKIPLVRKKMSDLQKDSNAINTNALVSDSVASGDIKDLKSTKDFKQEIDKNDQIFIYMPTRSIKNDNRELFMPCPCCGELLFYNSINGTLTQMKRN